MILDQLIYGYNVIKMKNSNKVQAYLNLNSTGMAMFHRMIEMVLEESPNALFPEFDTCCHQHDFCVGYNEISVKVSRTSSQTYYLFHESVESEFYNCLKNTETWLGKKFYVLFQIQGWKMFKVMRWVSKISHHLKIIIFQAF